MSRSLLVVLGLLASVLVACGGGSQPSPGPTVSRPAAATPEGGLSGTLVWRQAPYLHTGDLTLADVPEEALERLGEAEVGPERVPEEVFRRSADAPWELLSAGPQGWLVWEPLALVEARRQLVERLGVSPERIGVRTVEEVEWPDSCLGVPQPQEVCAEVITLGFRIELEAGADVYEYRSGRGANVRASP